MNSRIVKLYYYLKTIFLLKLNNIKYGKLPYMRGQSPILKNKGKFEVGNKFTMISNQFKIQITCSENAHLKFGDNVHINQGCNIYADKSIEIGDGVMIGDSVIIYDTNFHEVEEGEGVTTKPIIIENNVWIGARAIILPGVRIGMNSVVGAGSVVTKSMPENCLIAGVPAKKVKEIKWHSNLFRK
jgi:acetyltransferase-like isoleucine patch superfamily enzyme